VAIIAVLIALTAALAIYVHILLQPQRFTALLENELAQAGLTLTLQAAAKPRLFPHPGVRLEGLRLSNTGAGTPLLTARTATIVVPWRALLHGEVAIERVDIDAPHIDLGELKALLARAQFPAGPPVLPTITTGVHIRGGTLSAHGAPRLFGFSLDTGSLAPGKPFHLTASARSQSGHAFAARLVTVPSPPRDGNVVFKPVHITLRERGGAALRLHGTGRWDGGTTFALQLAGTLRHRTLMPPASASSTPAAGGAVSSAATTTDKLSLAITPERGTAPLIARFQLKGDGARVDATLQPTQLATWWRHVLAAGPNGNPLSMPFTGKATIRQIDLGGIKAKGLTIEAGPDLVPTAGSSSAPAASASTAGH
jgi:AsmA protein